MDHIIQALKEGKADRRLVILPRNLAIARLRNKLVDSLGYTFNLRITTFSRLVDQLSISLADSRRIIPDLVAEEFLFIISSQLNSHEAEPSLLRFLQRPSSTPYTLQTLRELLTAGINSYQLKQTGDPKFQTLAGLMEKYLSLCKENNFVDPAIRTLKVIEKTETEEDILGSIESIRVSGFAYVAPHYIRLLKALSRGRELVISLPSDNGRTDLFRENELLLSEAEGWNLKSGFRVSTAPEDPFRGEGIIGKLQRNLFAALAESLENDKQRISITAVPRRYDEVETVVCRILELIDKGVSPEKIGVTMRSIGPYDQFIRDVFGRYKIPFTYRRGIPLLQAQPVRTAMKLTELGQGDIRFDELLGVITSPHLILEYRDILREFIIRSKIYAEPAKQWAERLKAFELRRDDSKEENVRACDELAELLDRCAGIWESPKPLDDFKRLIDDKINPPGADIDAHSDISCDGLSLLKNRIEDISSDLDQLAVTGIKPSIHPIERLRAAIRTETVSIASRAQDAVQIFNFFDMGYANVDHLFCLGMDDKTTPKPVFRSGSLLNGTDIERLRRFGLDNHKSLKDPESLRKTEEQAFLLALGSARVEIGLYYPSLDEDGRETAISPYLAEIKRILGKKDQTENVLPAADQRTLALAPPDPLSVRRQVSRRLFRSDLPDEDALTVPIFNLLLEQEEERNYLGRLLRIREIESKRQEALFCKQEERIHKSSSYSGKIQSDDLLELIRRKFSDESYEWSATSIETFGRCPFDFYLKYCLQLEEFELAQEHLSPREEGLLWHRILKEFVDKSKYPLTDVSASIEQMMMIIDNQLLRISPGLSETDYPTTLAVLRERTRSLIKSFVKSEAEIQDRIPLPAEYEFGKDSIPCLIDLDDHSLRLSGRFDRVDRYSNSDGILVIDYKRRGGKAGFKDSILGHNLQLPLYLLAAERIFKAPLERSKAAIYNIIDTAYVYVDPDKSDRNSDWRYFFGLCDKPSGTFWSDIIKPVKLTEVLTKLVSQIQTAYFPIEGRNGFKVLDDANLVGRWLEIPPEMEAGLADE